MRRWRLAVRDGAFAGMLLAAGFGTAQADSLVMTLGDARDNRVGEIARTLDDNTTSGPARHITDHVRDVDRFIAEISALQDGDVLYLNTHSSSTCVSLGDGGVTFETIGRALRVDADGNPRRPPRLLALVPDGCMKDGTREDFEQISQTFNAELVVGWQTYTNSIFHTSVMLAILIRVFEQDVPLAELPTDRAPAFVGRPYLYAPAGSYGRSMSAVHEELTERLANGSLPDLGAARFGLLPPDTDDEAYCQALLEREPIFCVMPPGDDNYDQFMADWYRCCEP